MDEKADPGTVIHTSVYTVYAHTLAYEEEVPSKQPREVCYLVGSSVCTI